jgi:hypothetical protein
MEKENILLFTCKRSRLHDDCCVDFPVAPRFFCVDEDYFDKRNRERTFHTNNQTTSEPWLMIPSFLLKIENQRSINF